VNAHFENQNSTIINRHSNPPLQNPAINETLSLEGVSFDRGLRFQFADAAVLGAGEYAVLVSDSSAFAARFGSAGFLRLRVSDDD
jgi:hypothetical protein